MSSDIEPVFRVVDYEVADSESRVNALIELGYEPHGSATIFSSGGDLYQPMVKREMISVEEYTKMMTTMMDVAVKMQEKLREMF
jgi:hypothetical protein